MSFVKNPRCTRAVAQPFPGLAGRASRELMCNTGCGYKLRTQRSYVVTKVDARPEDQTRAVSFRLNADWTLYAHGHCRHNIFSQDTRNVFSGDMFLTQLSYTCVLMCSVIEPMTQVLTHDNSTMPN